MCSTSLHNTQQRGPSESEQQHSPAPKSGLANHPPRMNVNIRNCEMNPNEDERQFCLFSGQKDHVKSNVDFSNMQRDKSFDSDKNFHIHVTINTDTARKNINARKSSVELLMSLGVTSVEVPSTKSVTFLYAVWTGERLLLI